MSFILEKDISYLAFPYHLAEFSFKTGNNQMGFGILGGMFLSHVCLNFNESYENQKQRITDLEDELIIACNIIGEMLADRCMKK